MPPATPPSRGPRPGGPARVRFLLMRTALRLGPDEVSLRTLAAGAGVSVRMPLYVFGSLAGLHAAVALRGYTRLLAHLRRARVRLGRGREAALGLALTYIGFGLRHPGLWRTMHSRHLWRAMNDPGERVLVGRGTWCRGGDLFALLAERRAEAMREFTEGLLAALPERGSRLAPVLALLADGFLLQVHFEGGFPAADPETCRAWFGERVRALLGIPEARPTPPKARRRRPSGRRRPP